VSSTLVTLTFARQSHRDARNGIALAVGTVAACTILVPRILGLTLILNPALAPRTALGLLPTLLAGVLLIVVGWRHLRGGTPQEAPPPPRNPLQLRTAVLMAIGFQLVLILLGAVTRRFGESGVLASAAVLGLTDMDALTFSMNRLAQSPELISVAALAIVLGVTVNGAFKTVVSGVVGESTYRRWAVPALLLLTVAGAGGFWLLRLTAPGP
jgi:uncharacterized membrane protein (DUF4010 family)